MSRREELARRETAAAEQAERLRGQIAELTEQFAVAEQVLSRLAITRETMTEILVDAAEPESSEGPDENPNSFALQPVSASRSPIGVMLVP